MFHKSFPTVPFSNQAHADQLGQASILEKVTELSSEVLGPGSFPYYIYDLGQIITFLVMHLHWKNWVYSTFLTYLTDLLWMVNTF